MKINEMYIFKSLRLNKTQGDGSSSSFSHVDSQRFGATFMIIGLGPYDAGDYSYWAV